MATIKTFRPDVRAANRAPIPKRKPARLPSETAHFKSRSQRKPKSR